MTNKPKGRKIHVALPEDVHQRLRVKCALEDVTIQQYVARLLEKNVENIELPSGIERKARTSQ